MKIYNPYNRTSGGSNGGDNGGGFEYSAGDIYFGLNPPTNSVKLDGSLKSSNDFPELSNFFPSSQITGNYEIQTDQSTFKADYDIFDGLVDFQILKQIKHENKEYVLYATEDKDSLIVDMTDKLNPVIIEQMNSNTSSFPQPYWHMRGLANAIRQFTTFGTEKAYYTVVESDLNKISFYELDLKTGVKTLIGDNFPTLLSPFNATVEYTQIGYRSTYESFYFIPDSDNVDEFYILAFFSDFESIEVSKFNKTNQTTSVIGSYEFIHEQDFIKYFLFYEGDIEKSVNINTKEFYFNIFKYDSMDQYESKVTNFAKINLDNPSNIEIIEDLNYSTHYISCLPTVYKDNTYLLLLEDNFNDLMFQGIIEISGIIKYNSSNKVYLNAPDTYYKSFDKTGFDNRRQITNSIKIINEILFISTYVDMENTTDGDFIDFKETVGINLTTNNIEYSDFYQFSGDNNTTFRLVNEASITDFERVVFTDNNSFSITDYDSNASYLDFTYQILGDYILPKYSGDNQGFIEAHLII